jgi:hypothetical protein
MGHLLHRIRTSEPSGAMTSGFSLIVLVSKVIEVVPPLPLIGGE